MVDGPTVQAYGRRVIEWLIRAMLGQGANPVAAGPAAAPGRSSTLRLNLSDELGPLVDRAVDRAAVKIIPALGRALAVGLGGGIVLGALIASLLAALIGVIGQ